LASATASAAVANGVTLITGAEEVLLPEQRIGGSDIPDECRLIKVSSFKAGRNFSSAKQGAASVNA
jgi:hypothetical protein